MKVIGIAGYARCGKDTFVSIARDVLSKNNYSSLRVAFADNLKTEVSQMLKLNGFGLDAWATDTAIKNKLRPLLVWWGCARRDLSESGLYWVNAVDDYLRKVEADYRDNGANTENVVALVSDVRFANEADWIHNKWDGEVIHIRRFKAERQEDGEYKTIHKIFDEAPNAEEEKNDPLVRRAADVKIEWESRGIPVGASVNDDPYLKKCVCDALNSTKFFKHPAPITGTLSL